jgi:hypothetical protein
MYATVADLRAEGVTEAACSDTRLSLLIEEASRSIDRITGWFFEPRPMTLLLDGRGSPTIEPPVPPIRIDRLSIGASDLEITPNVLTRVGAPVAPGFDAPRLSLVDGGVFPRGFANVTARGVWGFTEHNGSPEGGTPQEIRRACMLLVLRLLHPLASEASTEARSRWRVLEERTRDQSYRLDSIKDVGPFTGDAELDRVLLRYRRPAGMGAV